MDMMGAIDDATAGGWQVLGTRVTGGELRIEAIEPSRVTVVEPS